MELERPDAGGRHTAVVGEEVVLRLPEAPTTGYRWTIEPDGLVLLDDRYDPPAARARGGTGVREVRLRADRAGPGEIVARERRPWDAADSDELRFGLDITPPDPGDPRS